MDHLMAIGAERDEILGRRNDIARPHGGNRNPVMDLDESLPEIAIELREIESAGMAKGSVGRDGGGPV